MRFPDCLYAPPLHAALAVALAVLPGHAVAAPDGAQATPAPACIELEVNGERIRDYACLARRLAPADSTAPSPAAAASEQRVRQAPSTLGLAHRAATQQRMGNSFGISTRPQRPAPAPAPPPVPVPPRPGY
ncbi:hypothetical protein [Stenotrophomonas rhizophila]|uniref:hypothetical protein n=1 Tax=Stenotrophomonas rhizophila TaxID=216778 RepID=UPI001E632D14|nr:hypothetical protein [Stenotrophomonas rhizophila]MCC7634417.1 hypothetical protein [Stenotrophomonas rhizophila]MCC7663815.1 hypothetical protein [Stenotrophomonas rhizophila]